MISIVVLTYNQLENCTIGCIESIYKYTDTDKFELLIVDNNSTDGTQDYLKSIKHKYSNLKIILNDTNKGYSGGNNDGIKAANGEYIILLNNDTLVSENWLQNLLKPFENDNKIGLVGPVSNSVGNEQRINIEGLTENNYNEENKKYCQKYIGQYEETNKLGFFCVAIKRELIDTIGYLDEKFGIGMFEDDDFCVRSQEAGFKNVFTQGAYVYHKGSVSFKKLTTTEYQDLFQKNKKYFFSKHNKDWTYSDILIAYFDFFQRVDNNENIKVREEDFSNLLSFIKEIELNSDVSSMEKLKKETLNLSDWATQLKEQVEEKEKIIEKKEQILTEKNAELLQMSDWASMMRDRLEKIDSHRTLRVLEKLLNKQVGPKKILKKILKKLVPQKYIDKYRFNKARVNFNEVVSNVSNNKKVIIAFPIITWGFRFQRPQHILKELSKKGYTIIYISMSITPKGVLFNSIEDAGTEVNFTKLDQDIYKIWIQSYENINIYTDHISDENLHNMSLSIQSALKVIQAEEITYLVQFPGWSKLVFDLKSKYQGKVVFDCMDDHSGFSTNDEDSLKEEKQLIKNSDLVISSSQVLFDKNTQINKNNIQVKNGTEFHHFNEAKQNGKLEYLNDRPIIGYYGAISDWFDMDIVEYCALKHPEYNFVMIGSTFGCEITKVEKIDNIHFLGEIPYKELPGYFAYFDVCLIPFKIIPLTLATNPVKFYEYLSAGKPVVSVRLPELIPYEDHCYLAEDKSEFCDKIEMALSEKSDLLIENRIKLAKENSWAQRAEDIYNNMKEVK